MKIPREEHLLSVTVSNLDDVTLETIRALMEGHLTTDEIKHHARSLLAAIKVAVPALEELEQLP
jgi:hypothetical protein